MKKRTLLVIFSAALISLSLATAADAALLSRLGGLAYYDTDANLTWLADANYAKTSGYAAANANGLGFNTNTINANGTTMGRAAANVWATGLNVAGVTGWRLPDTMQPDASCGVQSGHIPPQGSEFNCTGSEMGNLFYNVLGGVANTSFTTTHNVNYDLFSNIETKFYWSGTEFAPAAHLAWAFNFHNGRQLNGIRTSPVFAWAVQSGDVGVVPVPAAVWLFGSGLIGLIAVARRKSANS